jgi:hypothetical protein
MSRSPFKQHDFVVTVKTLLVLLICLTVLVKMNSLHSIFVRVLVKESLRWMWRKALVAYYNALSHFYGGTGANHESGYSVSGPRIDPETFKYEVGLPAIARP